MSQEGGAAGKVGRRRMAGHGMAMEGMGWHGVAWRGMAWWGGHGTAGHGMAWHGMAWHGRFACSGSQACLQPCCTCGMAWHGMAHLCTLVRTAAWCGMTTAAGVMLMPRRAMPYTQPKLDSSSGTHPTGQHAPGGTFDTGCAP